MNIHNLQATQTKHIKKMDHPSNGVYIIGFLRPAFEDEVDYIRRFFHGEDIDDHISDGKGIPPIFRCSFILDKKNL